MKKIWSNKKLWIIMGIVALAIISRFVFLGSRPVHHDEGMLAYFAWRLSESGDYIYTPQIHGPILFYVQALLFKLFGTSNFILRLGPAIFGVALVTVPLLFKKFLGWRRVLTVSLLFLISPVMAYYSRFLVHTALVVSINTLFLLFLYVFVKTKKSYLLYILSILLSIAFGISETSYIYVASLVLGVILIWLVSRRAVTKILINLKKYLTVNWIDVLVSVMIFVLMWILIYSVGLTSFQSLNLSLPNPFNHDTSLGFWLSQHPNRLGGQPWFYYILLFLVYQPLVFMTFLSGLINIKDKSGLLEKYLLLVSASSFAIYSWAGEKFPWLMLPTLGLFIIYAGLRIGRRWKSYGVYLKILIIALGLFSVFNTLRLVYFNPADTRELAVYVQTPESFDRIAKKIDDACARKGEDCVLIDSEISWPLSWMFKNVSQLHTLESTNDIGKNTKYVLTRPEMAPNIDSKSTKVYLRDWWVPPVCRDFDCVQKYLKYFLFRQIWGERGGYQILIMSL